MLVAPFVGAWIEMLVTVSVKSHGTVAPFVGAWIEMLNLGVGENTGTSRSVRRSVD